MRGAHWERGDSLVQTVGHDGVWMGRRVEMTRVGMGNVHGLKTKWVQVEESVSRKGGVLLIVVADHFISGIEPDFRSRCRCSRMSQRRHGRIRSAKDYIRLFPVFSRFPPLFETCRFSGCNGSNALCASRCGGGIDVPAGFAVPFVDGRHALHGGRGTRPNNHCRLGQTRGAMRVVRWADERSASVSGARRPAKPMDGRRIIRPRRPRLLEA